MPSLGLRWHASRFVRHGSFMLLGVAGQLLVRRWVPQALLRDANEVAGSFLQTFGGTYGVIVAFAIYVVWQEHNETQLTIEREATALAEVFRIIGFLKAWPARDATRAVLLEYARFVPQANHGERALLTTTERGLLDRALGDYLAYAPKNAQEERLYAGGLELFRELNQAREHRETVANLRLPRALRWFVFIGGAINVSALWLVWIESEVLQALFTAGMTWVVVAASSIVLDLDAPYTGDFVVNWGRFREVARHMEALPCPPACADEHGETGAPPA